MWMILFILIKGHSLLLCKDIWILLLKLMHGGREGGEERKEGERERGRNGLLVVVCMHEHAHLF